MLTSCTKSADHDSVAVLIRCLLSSCFGQDEQDRQDGIRSILSKKQRRTVRCTTCTASISSLSKRTRHAQRDLQYGLRCLLSCCFGQDQQDRQDEIRSILSILSENHSGEPCDSRHARHLSHRCQSERVTHSVTYTNCTSRGEPSRHPLKMADRFT